MSVVAVTAPGTVYRVGGCVRDELLGRKPHDVDYVVTGASVRQMLDAGFTQVGKDFPVFLHPATGDQYALARRERHVGPGRTDVATDVHGVPLVDDLARRDLRINAMAMAANGSLIDPFGGLGDLRSGILRHTSPACRKSHHTAV